MIEIYPPKARFPSTRIAFFLSSVPYSVVSQCFAQCSPTSVLVYHNRYHGYDSLLFQLYRLQFIPLRGTLPFFQRPKLQEIGNLWAKQRRVLPGARCRFPCSLYSRDKSSSPRGSCHANGILQARGSQTNLCFEQDCECLQLKVQELVSSRQFSRKNGILQA